LAKDLSLPALARQAGMSERSFSNLISPFAKSTVPGAHISTA
jgi:transcriptional regulator GlxA family with amidase domain